MSINWSETIGGAMFLGGLTLSAVLAIMGVYHIATTTCACEEHATLANMPLWARLFPTALLMMFLGPIVASTPSLKEVIVYDVVLFGVVAAIMLWGALDPSGVSEAFNSPIAQIAVLTLALLTAKRLMDWYKPC